MSPETQVKFNLWTVLAFLVLAGMSSFTFLYAEGKETKLSQQTVIQRVVALETMNKAVLDGISRLEVGQKEVANALNNHEKSTVSLMKVKKWNDMK